MYGYFSIGLTSLVVIWLITKLLHLRAHVAVVKEVGLPYAIAPLSGIAGFFWMAIHDPVLNLLKSLPISRDWLWVMLIEPHRGWYYAQELRERFGEAFMIASPGQMYMNICNADAILQITTRRNDFQKPIEIYGIVDIFGKSVLTTEGPEWKRHRKIVAPAFSEKSNALVWRESLNQAVSMLKFWSKLDGNGPTNIRVKDTTRETSLMTLHVISGAGFGVRQVWKGESEDTLGTKVVPGFNTAELSGNHKLAFKDAIDTLLHGMIWVGIFPTWVLKLSPLAVNKKLMQSYTECGDYFKELSARKVQQLESGEAAEKGTMDLLGPLVQASEKSFSNSKDLYLTKQEVIGNSFIFLFAGHETSANTTHYAFLFLAIALDSQARLQADIDAIVGSQAPSEWTYETNMRQLYQSMVGATMNETLRLMPPIIDIPKITRTPQSLNIDGKTITIPTNTFIHLNAVGVQRNPRYWPHSVSKISSKTHDLDDFIPERWLSSSSYSSTITNPSRKHSKLNISSNSKRDSPPPENLDAPTDTVTSSFDTPFPSQSELFTPIKGSYIPFSDGARSCPGRRFAQVEITAVLAVLFSTHSLELDVSEWASDAEVENMGSEEKGAVYARAISKTRMAIAESETVITMQMRSQVPVRWVLRGKERFRECIV